MMVASSMMTFYDVVAFDCMTRSGKGEARGTYVEEVRYFIEK